MNSIYKKLSLLKFVSFYLFILVKRLCMCQSSMHLTNKNSLMACFICILSFYGIFPCKKSIYCGLIY